MLTFFQASNLSYSKQTKSLFFKPFRRVLKSSVSTSLFPSPHEPDVSFLFSIPESSYSKISNEQVACVINDYFSIAGSSLESTPILVLGTLKDAESKQYSIAAAEYIRDSVWNLTYFNPDVQKEDLMDLKAFEGNFTKTHNKSSVSTEPFDIAQWLSNACSISEKTSLKTLLSPLNAQVSRTLNKQSKKKSKKSDLVHISDVTSYLERKYFESLYALDTPLSYFAKSALSRARAVCKTNSNSGNPNHSNETKATGDSATTNNAETHNGLIVLIKALVNLMLELADLDAKYETSNFCRIIGSLSNHSGSVCSKTEEKYLRDWKNQLSKRNTTFPTENLQNYTEQKEEGFLSEVRRLKVREIQMQLIVALEILSLKQQLDETDSKDSTNQKLLSSEIAKKKPQTQRRRLAIGSHKSKRKLATASSTGLPPNSSNPEKPASLPLYNGPAYVNLNAKPSEEDHDTDDDTDQSDRISRKLHLKINQLDLQSNILFDRLCIWQAIAPINKGDQNDLESVSYKQEPLKSNKLKAVAEKPGSSLSGRRTPAQIIAESDKAQEFCRDIVLPFFNSKLHEKCKMFIKTAKGISGKRNRNDGHASASASLRDNTTESMPNSSRSSSLDSSVIRRKLEQQTILGGSISQSCSPDDGIPVSAIQSNSTNSFNSSMRGGFYNPAVSALTGGNGGSRNGTIIEATNNRRQVAMSFKANNPSANESSSSVQQTNSFSSSFTSGKIKTTKKNSRTSSDFEYSSSYQYGGEISGTPQKKRKSSIYHHIDSSSPHWNGPTRQYQDSEYQSSKSDITNNIIITETPQKRKSMMDPFGGSLLEFNKSIQQQPQPFNNTNDSPIFEITESPLSMKSGKKATPFDIPSYPTKSNNITSFLASDNSTSLSSSKALPSYQHRSQSSNSSYQQHKFSSSSSSFSQTTISSHQLPNLAGEIESPVKPILNNMPALESIIPQPFNFSPNYPAYNSETSNSGSADGLVNDSHLSEEEKKMVSLFRKQKFEMFGPRKTNDRNMANIQ